MIQASKTAGVTSHNPSSILGLSERVASLEVRVENLNRLYTGIEKNLGDLNTKASELAKSIHEMSMRIERLQEFFTELKNEKQVKRSFRNNLITGGIVALITGIVQIILKLFF